MGVHKPTIFSRRDALKLFGTAAGGLFVASCTRNATPQALPTPDQQAMATDTMSGENDFSNRWPETAQDFLKAIQVSQDQIPAEYLADPYYRPLQAGMLTQEFDAKGKWTGGWQVLLERNSGDQDKFPFVVIKNPGPMMQYGFMHDANLRAKAGFTAEEVQLLGIGNNHIGAGIPVTNKPIAVEGLTFYPFVNTVDGSNNKHFIYAKLGPDMQTLNARLARSAQK